METVDAWDDGRQGIVHAVERVVTAPYGQSPGERTGVDRLPSSATWRAPDLQSLFGSQDGVTAVISAPTGVGLAPEPRTVAFSRVALAALGALVFVCGAVIGTTAMRRAPGAPGAALAEPTPAEAVPATPAVLTAAEPALDRAAPTTISVPEPVKITARKHLAVRRASPKAEDAAAPASAPWVDPFAD